MEYHTKKAFRDGMKFFSNWRWAECKGLSSVRYETRQCIATPTVAEV